jgi:WD40 repeat protein
VHFQTDDDAIRQVRHVATPLGAGISYQCTGRAARNNRNPFALDRGVRDDYAQHKGTSQRPLTQEGKAMRTRCVLCLLFGLASVPAAGAEPLPPGARARLGTTDLWHGPAVSGLVFAPDGKTFYSFSSGDAAVRQWDAATGHEVRSYAGAGERVAAFALSPGGRLLAVAGADRTVRVWGTDRGDTVASWPRKQAVQSLAFSADGKTLAVLPGEENETVALLDAATGRQAQQLKFESVQRDDVRMRLRIRNLRDLDEERSEGAVTFSPDGRHLAAIVNQTITLWDLGTHKKVRRYDLPRDRTGEPAFSADGQTLHCPCEGGVFRWEVGSIEGLEPLKGNNEVCAFAVSADGKTLAAVGARTVFVWDAAGKRVATLESKGEQLAAVACSPDGKTVVSGDRDGLIRVWDVEGKKERLLPGVRPHFRALGFVGAGPETVSSDEHGIVHWDAAGKEARRVPVETAAEAERALCPDGRTLAARGDEGEVRLFDTVTGELRVKLEGKGRKACRLAFSPDGRRVAVLDANPENPVSVYDARTGKELRRLGGAALAGRSIAFLPDGRSLLTNDGDNGVCLWELATGKPRRVLRVGAGARPPVEDNYLDLLVRRAEREGGKALRPTEQVAVSPDARALALVQQNTVSVIDLATGKRLTRLEGPAAEVLCVAYSPDGKLLVTGGEDRLVRFWEAATGREVGALAGHRGPMRRLIFSPDGKTLATAGDEPSALVWDVAQAVEVARRANQVTAAAQPLDRLWADLSGDDPLRADAAARELASRPKEALPLLKERLRPAATADAKAVARWVVELESDTFEARETAATELERAGEQARPALEAVVKGQPSSELKRRVGELLKKLDEHVYPAEVVRDLRALEVAEKIGDSAAHKIIEAMAAGAAGDPRTLDAKAVLERLRRK